MFVGAQRSSGTGSGFHDQFRNKLELDDFHRDFGMQRDRLHRVSERNVDRYDHDPLVQRDRLVGFDAVYFLDRKSVV